MNVMMTIMVAVSSAIINDRAEALSLIRQYIETGNNEAILPRVQAMTTPDDEQVFAIMQGSGNELPLFQQFLHVVSRAGFIDRDEGLEFALEAVKAGQARRQ